MLFTKKKRDAIFDSITSLTNTLTDLINKVGQNEGVEGFERHKLIARINKLESDVKSSMDVMRREMLEEFKVEARKAFKTILEEDRQTRYESDEPYVEVVSEHFSESDGVQLRLDWNEAFIKLLAKNGITGASPEAMVDNWLLSLSMNRAAEAGREFR